MAIKNFEKRKIFDGNPYWDFLEDNGFTDNMADFGYV